MTAINPPLSYKSLAKEHRIEYVVEKSRFIATAAPCTTEEEVQAFFARVTKEFWDASHNCTAYALGPRQEQQRSSDNGEPSGTAGKPMLEVLKKMEITNTAVVVTRYFGGIKLGAGGLIRAYSHSAAEVLQNAAKLLHAPRQIILLIVEYGHYNSVERYLQEQSYHYRSRFEADVHLTLFLPPEKVAEVEAYLTDLTNGSLLWEPTTMQMVAIPLKEVTAPSEI